MARNLFDPAPPSDLPEAPLTKRLLWFVVIAAASGLVVAITAYALRGLLFIG